MKTVYFPYTTIDSGKAGRMAAIWGPLYVLQPSADTCLPETQKLSDAGHVVTVLPTVDADRPLQEILADFKQWAAQNAGSDLAAMMERGQAIPFFSQQSATQIVAEIRKGENGPATEAVDDTASKKLQAQLLLAMAQELDDHQQALRHDIETLAAQEKEMLAQLKGENEMGAGGFSLSPMQTEDTVGLMTPHRLNAWARVMATTEETLASLAGQEADLLFLTDDASVLEQVQEAFPEAVLRLRAHPMMSDTSFRTESGVLPDWLAAVLKAQPPMPSGQQAVRFPSFYLLEIPNTPAAMFPRCLARRLRRERTRLSAAEFSGSCWVGCMTDPG